MCEWPVRITFDLERRDFVAVPLAILGIAAFVWLSTMDTVFLGKGVLVTYEGLWAWISMGVIVGSIYGIAAMLWVGLRRQKKAAKEGAGA